MTYLINIFAVLGGLLCIYEVAKVVKRIIQERRVFSWREIQNAGDRLFDEIVKSEYRPDIIVGLGRGGAIVAGLIAARFREYEPFHGKMIPIGILDRIYILDEKGERVDVVITGIHHLDVHEKNVLVLNADTYSGTTLNEARKALRWDRPSDVKRGSLFVFERRGRKPVLEPNFHGETPRLRKADKRLPWRAKEYPLEDERDLHQGDSILVVLHGLVATGKTSATDAIVKDLGFTPIYSDWYWFKYGLQRRNEDHSVSQRHNEHMLALCKSVIVSGCSAVLDCTSRWKSFRDDIRKAFHDLRVPVVFVRCSCPRDSALQRIRKRRVIGPHDFGTKYEYERVLRDFNEIEENEINQINLVHADTDALEVDVLHSTDMLALESILSSVCSAIKKEYFDKLPPPLPD
ncbi:MAG: AAA family ATPase [Planctomycetota bacterium]|jgi:hypoxanthine phosphoribosyltransferase/predicted kinase